MEPFILLGAYFLKHLSAAIVFLIPLGFLWLSARFKGVKSRGLTYVLLGFFVGFLAQMLEGFLGAFVYKLPILPRDTARAKPKRREDS